MSVEVKHRRDTATNIAGFTPAQGELIVDTTNNRVILGDGSTVGGIPLAKLSEAGGAAVGANGSKLALAVSEVALTGLSGASVNATSAIPAGAIVVACAVRVTTTITGATSFSVGYTGSTSAFGTGLSVSSGTTNQGGIAPLPFAAATDAVVTSAGGSFTAGAVRLSVMYLSVTPPTS